MERGQPLNAVEATDVPSRAAVVVCAGAGAPTGSAIAFVPHRTSRAGAQSRGWTLKGLLGRTRPIEPAVSVIIPVRNGAPTIVETVRSLQRQSMARWQAIVVDDGSSDETVAVVDGLAALDARIRCLSQPASGVSAARNRGLAAAVTPWVLFLDADDWIASDYFEHMLAALAANPHADAAFCGSHRVLPDGRALAELPGSDMNFPRELQSDPVRVLSESCPFAIHSIVVRRAIFERSGVFDESLVTSEDWDLWLRISRCGAQFVGVPRPLAFYRMRTGGPSTKSVRIVRDAQLVIRRAHQFDPRIRAADSRYTAGLLGEDVAARLAGVTFYFAGVTAGEGGDVGEVLRTLHEWPDLAHDERLRDAARDVEAGLAVGARRTHATLCEDWHRLVTAITTICECVDQHASRRGAGQRCFQHIEDIVIRAADLAQPRVLSTIQGFELDLASPLKTIEPHPSVDRVFLRVRCGELALAEMEVPSAFPLQPMELALLLLRHWRMDRHLVPPEMHIGWRRVYGDLMRLMMGAEEPGRRHTLRQRFAAARRLPALLKLASEPVRLPEQECERARRAINACRARGAELAFTGSEIERDAPRAVTAPHDEYALQKAERALALLPHSLGSVLVLHEDFPLQSVLGTRAAELRVERISEAAHAPRPPAGSLDAVICYESLDRLPDQQSSCDLIRELVELLRPDGCLLTVHEFAAHEDPAASGFDRERPRGARSVHDLLLRIPELTVERSVRTELYRIDLFRRSGSGRALLEEVRPLDCSLDPSVERQVIWGGAVTLRRHVASEAAVCVPVMMYHSIAADGPAALAQWRLHPQRFEQQLRYFRRHGYRSVSSEELLGFIRDGKPLHGRPLMLTFDDGYSDFLTGAWPILRRYEFTAEVFLVTDRVGGSADWDRSYGAPARLMDWDQVLYLQREGIAFGSHSATHRRCDRLTTAELLEEAVRSRCALEARLQRPTTALAMPFGVWDARMLQTLEWAGYELAFTTAHGVAAPGMNPLALPRIEVFGTEDIETFAKRFEQAVRVPGGTREAP